MEGLIIVEELGEKNIAESLYQHTWEISEFGPKTEDEKIKIAESGRKRFFKK